MELDSAIRGRRAIRKYRQEEIADGVVEDILDVARYAPSSMDGQPWQFIVVRDAQTKKKLAEIKNAHCPIEKQAFRADFIQCAPVIIVVCVDKGRSYDREIENGLLVAANILLAAYSRGIGSVYMSARQESAPALAEEIQEALGIPPHIHPISLLPLGYPDETPRPKGMKPLEEFVSYEAYGRRQIVPGSKHRPEIPS
jgi:nitroreductase